MAVLVQIWQVTKHINALRDVLPCMNVTFAERLEARLALRLRSSAGRRSWICDGCRTRLGRQQQPFHRKISTERKNAGASINVRSFSDYAEERRVDTSRGSIQDSHAFVRPERVSRVRTEASSNGFGAGKSTLSSKLVDSDNWAAAQWRENQPFREFLETQAQPETRFVRRKDPSDTYGILLALRMRDLQKMIAGLEQAADDGEYLRSIPRTTWAEIMHAIHAQTFNINRHKIHRSFNQKQQVNAGFDRATMVQQYLSVLTRILRIRRDHGITPYIVDYHVLLSFAAEIGAEEAARRFWADMKRDGVPPDRLCYNHFMNALIWDENSRLRLKRKAKDALFHHAPKSTNIALFAQGKSGEIVELINKMRQDGIQPDVTTYCTYMSVLARDADFESAINLLSAVWKINIRALESGRDDAPLKEKYPSGSLLYPTPRLLVTIAEVYGLANRMPAGFRVVDYISRHYAIPLSKNIWYQLLRWTWLQARVKEHERTIPEDDAQQLQEKTVRILLETMIEDPYNIELDLDLYKISFNNFMESPFAFTHAFDPSLAIEIAESVRLEYVKLLQEKWESEQRVAPQLKDLPSWRPFMGAASLRFTYPGDRVQTRSKLHRMTLVKWTSQMLTLPRAKHGIDLSTGPHNETLTDWRVRGVPRFLSLMATFAPSNVRYHTDTGIVDLTFRTPAETEIAKIQVAAGGYGKFSYKHPEHSRLNIRLAGARRVGEKRNELFSFRRQRVPSESGLYESSDGSDDIGYLSNAKHVHWQPTPNLEP